MANDGIFPGLSLRQPPQNPMAEAAILGAILRNNACREQCVDLCAEHFAVAEHAALFSMATGRIDLGERVDGVTLKGHFDQALLADVIASVIGFDIKAYVSEVREKAAARRLIELGELLVTQAFAGTPAIGLARDVAAQIDSLANAGGEGSGVMLDVAMAEAISAMEQAIERKGPIGLSSGFRCIDERLGGLEDETLTVIAARPGMGKTALACDIALRVAQAGIPVLMWSLEMSRMQLARRLLASASGIPIIAMKRGSIGVDAAGRVVAARKGLSGLPLWIEDGTGIRASAITSRTRSWRRKHPGPALAIVDHIHLVRHEDGDIRSGATYAVGQVSGALKRATKTCQMPIIALAQLNRGVEGREDKRPGLSDLRASGDIEQDADSVGFLYRAEYYLGNKPEKRESETDKTYEARLSDWANSKEKNANRADLIWAKVRDGEAGTDSLRFDGPTASFSEDE